MLKFLWNLKGPRIANPILKNERIGGFVFSDFKMYHKVVLIKTVWYWPKDRHTDQ